MTSLSYIQPVLWQISCQNFQIFVTMAIGVGVKQILHAQLNSPTLKTLCLVQELGTYLVYKPTYSNFLLKFSKFSLPWQQGSSEQSLTDTIKLADPENPLLCACIWAVSPTQAKL